MPSQRSAFNKGETHLTGVGPGDRTGAAAEILQDISLGPDPIY